tara:strand:+ start:206 stop:649 length:444 start_codon:yes stop_codon:yes gene_type:complete
MSASPVSQPLLVSKQSFFTKKKFLIVLGIVLVLLVCGGLYYWKYMRQAEGYQEKKTSGEFKLYFASWCGWSKKFLPEWEKLEETEKRVTLTKYTCDGDDKEKCDDPKANIKGYPSMRFHKEEGDDGVEYDGERTAEAISEWITKKLE